MIPILEDLTGALIARGEDSIPELVDFLIFKAIENRATDIHIKSVEETCVVLYRIDGVLIPAARIPETLKSNFFYRLKLIASLPGYKKREPQDGRIDWIASPNFLPELKSLGWNQKEFTFRASFIPTLFGESATIRIPDISCQKFTLEDLGMSDEIRSAILKSVSKLEGVLLLTGPASSGKTTTIYSLLKRILENFQDRLNVCTLEDPVEIPFPGINQTSLDPVGGLTYAEWLKAVLRQDPNVIVVGEIRDPETAAISIRAGFTGHLVISTIHCGRAIGVFERLLNMGIEPYLVASAVNGVLAQRLIRLACNTCARWENVDRSDFGFSSEAISLIPEKERVGAGCVDCLNTGFRGRTGCFEFLPVTEKIRKGVIKRLDKETLHQIAIKEGLYPLATSAIKAIEKGLTTIAEVLYFLSENDFTQLNNSSKKRD